MKDVEQSESLGTSSAPGDSMSAQDKLPNEKSPNGKPPAPKKLALGSRH